MSSQFADPGAAAAPTSETAATAAIAEVAADATMAATATVAGACAVFATSTGAATFAGAAARANEVPAPASDHALGRDATPCGDRRNDVFVRWRGAELYQASFDAMRAFTDARTPQTIDEIWLVEHPPVYTLGQAGDPAHLLAEQSGIALVKVDRGGQITYHGPGQIVAYLLIDLRRRKLMVRDLVNRIEQAAIETLAAYNLAGERRTGAPGIYVAAGASYGHAGAKIAALGLKIRNGCSYHGVSLNVQMNLQPFLDINPCGYAGLETIDMASLGVAANWRDVAQTLAGRLIGNLPPVAAGIIDAPDAPRKAGEPGLAEC